MRYLLTLALTLAAASTVHAAPSLALSAYQVTPGTAVVVHATGYTPHGIVISHLTRPDGTEYPSMTFEADASGQFSHTVRIVPTMIGTYELRMADRDSRAEASARFMMMEVGSELAPNPSGASLPAGFSGVWEGSATQKGGDAAGVVVTLAGGSPGGVVGTVAYPSMLCGGELWLIGVYGDSVQLGEKITYGEERCTGRGVVTVRSSLPGGVAFSWRNAYIARGPATSGTLVRR